MARRTRIQPPIQPIILRTWKAIGQAVNLSARGARDAHRRRPMPLVFETPNGSPWVSVENLLRWHNDRLEQQHQGAA